MTRELPHKKAASEEADAAFLLIRRQLIGLRRSVGGWWLVAAPSQSVTTAQFGYFALRRCYSASLAFGNFDQSGSDR